MKDFINEHFAVLIVLIVFVFLFGAYMYQVRHAGTAENLDWLEGEMKEVVGAILMGLTGKGIQIVSKSNEPPPAAPPQP